MRFYVASSIHNAENVKKVVSLMERNGHQLTYDWVKDGNVRSDGPDRMGEVAFFELRSVIDAELVLVMLPGGAGTHTELGISLASRTNKRILVWSEDSSDFTDPKKNCVFYFHPAIERLVCPFEELLDRMNAIM